MLTFVCWKWRRSATGHQLPSVCDYTARHVNTLQRMLARHVRIPHRLVCLTDDPAGVECETWPVPETYAELGGCYRRLWMFSPEAGDVLGERFVSIDLDVVLMGDCSHLADRSEPLVMNQYHRRERDPDQYYNGGLMLIEAGARSQVWEEFDPVRSPAMVAQGRRAGICIGTDQAWIRIVLGKGEARYTEADGVYEGRTIPIAPPPDARLVLFAGRRDPSCDVRPWVRENWC